jgi:hypothetical protein
MNGSAEDRASGASESPGRPDAVLSLPTAQRMLPLVQRIIGDLLDSQRRLASLLPEQGRLDRQRRTLAWPERARRYHVHEEVAAHEQYRLDALAELEVLGLTLMDPVEGRVGFPTIINKRQAFFSWRPGQESLRSWHFAGETTLRPIPASWSNALELKPAEKGS